MQLLSIWSPWPYKISVSTSSLLGWTQGTKLLTKVTTMTERTKIFFKLTVTLAMQMRLTQHNRSLKDHGCCDCNLVTVTETYSILANLATAT